MIKQKKRRQGRAMPQWLYHNPGIGPELSPNHPVQSGECPDAENIRPATNRYLMQELVAAWKSRAEAEQESEELARRVMELEDANASLLEKQSSSGIVSTVTEAGQAMVDKVVATAKSVVP